MRTAQHRHDCYFSNQSGGGSGMSECLCVIFYLIALGSLIGLIKSNFSHSIYVCRCMQHTEACSILLLTWEKNVWLYDWPLILLHVYTRLWWWWDVPSLALHGVHFFLYFSFIHSPSVTLTSSLPQSISLSVSAVFVPISSWYNAFTYEISHVKSSITHTPGLLTNATHSVTHTNMHHTCFIYSCLSNWSWEIVCSEIVFELAW